MLITFQIAGEGTLSGVPLIVVINYLCEVSLLSCTVH